MNIGCDQASKKIVRNNLEYHEVIPVLGESFYLTKVENKGAMLSFGAGLKDSHRLILFTVFPIFALVLGLFILLIKKKMPLFELLGYSLVIAGGIGNIMDRVLYKSVTDFMNMGIGSLRTGIFNYADVVIMVGIFLVLGQNLLSKLFAKKTKVIDFAG